jgi:4-amino-4-deoxy-L-arabinose transferase-like glycosyltransferase
MSPRLLRRILIALLAAGALAYAIDLGGSSIWDANEAFYVETPREMVERGDYVNPTFNYEPRINKPVLSYWLVAAVYKTTGVSLTAERAVIALAALVLIAAAFSLGRAASTVWTTAWLAALGIAANPRFFMFGRRILVDVLLASLMTLTLLFFAWAERHPARRRLYLVLMYVSVGLGMLAKGPVAAVLPAIVFLTYLIYHREFARLRTMMLPQGVLIVVAIVAPWYVALYQSAGWEPIRTFFVGENLERYTSPIGMPGRGPFFYLPIVFSDGLPWSLLLPLALWGWFRRRRDPASDAGARVRSLLVFWILAFVAVFSLSSTKQDLYILPIAAAVATLGADVLSREAFGVPALRNGVRMGLMITGLVLAAAGAAVFYVFEQAGAAYVLSGTALLGAAGAAGGVATAVFATRRSHWSAITLVATLIAVNWILLVRVLPDFERYKPVVALSETIRQRIKPDDVVIHYNVALPSMVYYLRRHIDTVYSREEFLERARGPVRVFGVMPEDVFADLQSELGPSACVVARRATFDAKLRQMLERRAPTAVVVVSTRCDRLTFAREH